MSNLINNNITKLNFENKDAFNMLLIQINNMSELKWDNPNYLNDITNLSSYKIINTKPENFLDNIVDFLDVNKYNTKGDFMIETQIISEFPEYIYELIYINNFPKEDELKNDLATLLITNGETIYGNVLLLKTFLPINNNQMLLVDSKVDDIKFILETRTNTNVVLYDSDEWTNKIIIGNMDDFAKSFFENESFLKYEFPFLSHNINIWYQKLDGGNNINICGKILEKPIYKCIWFTMISDEYRGSLLLDEVQKIIKLSYYLDYPYKPLEEWRNEEKDIYNRTIIKNKYRILEIANNHFLNKK